MNADALHRYRLVGDEDCGVGIECRDHFDGGRPLAYYSDDPKSSPYADDPAVVDVSTIPSLLAAAMVHEHEAHHEPTVNTVNVYPSQFDPSTVTRVEARARLLSRGIGL